MGLFGFYVSLRVLKDPYAVCRFASLWVIMFFFGAFAFLWALSGPYSSL